MSAFGDESHPQVLHRTLSPIGIDPMLTSLVHFRDGQFFLGNYNKYGVLLHMASNPAIAVDLLRERPPDRLADVLAAVIEDKGFRSAIDLFQLVPGVSVDDVLPRAIRLADKKTRQFIVAEIGTFSDYFCRLARASRSESGEFVGEGPENRGALLHLLDPIREEEGPRPALLAGFFCLSKLNSNDKYLIVVLRFLLPLLAGQEPRLKQQFDQLVSQYMVDRLVRFKIKPFVNIATTAKVPIAKFLRDHVDIDQRMAVDGVAHRLRPLVSRGQLPVVFRQALERADWHVWTEALASIHDE
jgi:hypothetical protein